MLLVFLSAAQCCGQDAHCWMHGHPARCEGVMWRLTKEMVSHGEGVMTGKGVVSRLSHSLHRGIWVSEARSCMCAKSLQSCPALCDPLDCSLLGSSVHGILQARMLEWVAMASSRGASGPRD